jgi:hypothetical protein
MHDLIFGVLTPLSAISWRPVLVGLPNNLCEIQAYHQYGMGSRPAL